MSKRFIFSGLACFLLCNGMIAKGQFFEKSFGYRYYDVCNKALEISDLNFMIFGSSRPDSTAMMDTYLAKIDAKGDTLWSRSYGGSEEDAGIGIVKSSDDGYLLAVTTSSVNPGNYDIQLIKINDAGDTIWTRTYGGPGTDYAHSLNTTLDGGYVVLAHTMSYGNGSGDFYLLRFNQTGDTLWTKTYGGTGFDWGGCVQQTSDGGFILTGDTQSKGDNDGDAYLVKTNSDGDTLWTRVYGGDDYDRAYHVIQTKDNGYLLSAVTKSFGGEEGSCYLVRTNETGDTLWTRVIGGSKTGSLKRSLQVADGNFIILGYISAEEEEKVDIVLTKVDTSGNILWTRYFGGTGHDLGNDLIETSDKGFLITGYTESFEADKDYDFYLVKTNGEGTFTQTEEHELIPVNGESNLLSGFPNPFSQYTTIRYVLPAAGETEVSIFDVSGRKLETLVRGYMPAGSHTYTWDAGDYPGGVYFCTLRTAKNTAVIKILHRGEK
ncbi:MAG: T9SS type A sorting domain-containing protein [Bacteroidales bacterium]|nr:T9SS type A sorting domain-containing protein [Bacteroidales bacterium]